MVAMSAVVITEEQLRAAWAQRKRATWPSTFEDAMNDPHYSRILRIEVRLRSNFAKRAEERQPALLKHPPALKPAQMPLIPTSPPVLDHKRRASGERDDD